VRDLAEVGRGLQAFQHVNRKAVEQFENFSEELRDLKQRKEEVDAAEESIQQALQRIDAQKESTLLQTLRRVNEHFQEVFSELVPGGAGKLRVVRQSDTEDTTVDSSAASTMAEDGANSANSSCLGELLGVRIEVSFTGQAQSFLSMSQLSGGQKTVVALSLIFGIQRLEPAPFYLLDEVDAALDASYRSALANLVAKTAKTSQVVLTTFRPEVLDKADRCYRVYQQNRASRIDVITSEQAKQVLREQDRLAQAGVE
jgi:structural maintenance of chromosome 3 (chondroitin sulfate proteoglycan 6)